MLTFQTPSTQDRSRIPLTQRQPRYRTRNRSKAATSTAPAPSSKRYRDASTPEHTDSDDTTEPEEDHDSPGAATQREDSPPPRPVTNRSPRSESPDSAPPPAKRRATIHRAAQGLFQNAKSEMGNRLKLAAHIQALQKAAEEERIPRDIMGFEPLGRVYATHRGTDGSIDFSPEYHTLLKEQAAARYNQLVEDLDAAHKESIIREDRFRALMAAVYESENDDGLPEALEGLERASAMYKSGEDKKDKHFMEKERALGTLTSTKITSLLVQPMQKPSRLKSPLKVTNTKRPRSLLKSPRKVTYTSAPPTDRTTTVRPGNPPATPHHNHRRNDNDRRRDKRPTDETRRENRPGAARNSPKPPRRGHRDAPKHPYQPSQPRDGRPTLPPRQRDRYTQSQRDRRPKSPTRSQLLDLAISALKRI